MEIQNTLWSCHSEPLGWRQHMVALYQRGCGVKTKTLHPGRWNINFHVVVKVVWGHDHINNAGVSQRSSSAQGQQVRQVWSSGIKEALKQGAEKMFFIIF